MTDAWGANTFLVRKQLPDLYFLKFVGLFLVFLTFSSNKRWWQLCTFSFLGRCTREPCLALLPKGRLQQLATPLGTIFRELGHFNLCAFLTMTFSCVCFLLFFLCSYVHITPLMYFAYYVVVILIYASINIYSF